MKSLRALLPMWFVYATIAHAGIVRVVANGASYGQGWMFLDVDSTCKVATPAHVIKLIDGRLASTIQILDEWGRTFSDVVPEAVSDQLDVAVLTVDGASDPQTCGTGRLSVIGMARRVATMSGAILETTGPDEVVRVPVRARAASIDSDKGSMFTVQPTVAKDRVIKGWSGSVIVDEDGPLGMVVKVDDERNEAFAVRADVIRQLIDSSRAKPQQAINQTNRTFPPIILTTGSTPDASSTPAAMFAPGGQGWNVVPKNHQIAFVVVLESPIRLQSIRLSFKSTTSSVEGMDIAVSQAVDGTGWESLKYCRAVGGSGTINCSILAATVTRIRLSLKTSADGQVALSGLTIE
jgi:hypothetical protein